MKRHEHGFASLETLLAVTLVAVMLLSTAVMFLTAHSSVKRSGDGTIAVASARQIMEEVRALPFDSLAALNGLDTTNPSSLPADDPEREVARRWRYAVAGEGSGWSFTSQEKSVWSTFAQPGPEVRGRIDVTQPSPSMRSVTVSLVIPGSPSDVQFATLVSRTTP